MTQFRDALMTLREKEKNPGGVCSDASLSELARLAPAEKSELLYIKGLGRAFYDRWIDCR